MINLLKEVLMVLIDIALLATVKVNISSKPEVHHARIQSLIKYELFCELIL